MKKVILAIAAFLAASMAGAQSYDANGNLLVRIERVQGSAPSATNPLPTRLSNGTSFIVPLLDTTLTARWPTGSTPGDNESNAVTTTRVGSFTYVFDGSAWDRWTGIVTANQGGTWTIDTITNPVAVTGTFWQATQPVSSTQLPAALVGGRLDVVIGAAVPAGNNNIGDVDVVTLPSIPAGTNNIGDVDVLTLPAIPAGTNNIGDVDVASIAAGNNNIGDVDVATIAAGNNNIGDVDVASIAAGNNNIGDVDIASAIPAGNNNIGDVDAIQSGTWSVRTQDGSGNALESSTTAPALNARGLVVRPADSTRTVTDNLDCTAASDAITISGEGASSVVVTFPAGFGGACVISFEGSGDGSNFVPVPAVRLQTTGVNHFDEALTIAVPSSQQWRFTQSGFRSYRARVSTTGTGNGTATMDANTGVSDVDTALYFTGTSTFDLTIPSNSLSITTKGASMIAFSFSSTIGASTVSFTHGGSAAECYQQGSASGGSRTSITGALNSILFLCPLYGASTFTFTKDAGIGSGTPVLTFYTSMSGQKPDEKRYVTEWTRGSSPTSVTVGSPKQLLTPEGQLAVSLDHPRSFSCAMTSTATTSTTITGCFGAVSTLGAPGAGLRFYITSYSWGSSIISTTTNFMSLQYGTGGTCGTGTTVFHRGFIPAAFNTLVPDIGNTPIPIAQNNEVCFVHPGAGTRVINIRGYVAP